MRNIVTVVDSTLLTRDERQLDARSKHADSAMFIRKFKILDMSCTVSLRILLSPRPNGKLR